MGRQEEALRVAEELLTDIELERLKASEVVLKASRIARLVGHDELSEFLSYERNGYPKGVPAKFVDRAGRWASDDREKCYTAPTAKVEAHLDVMSRDVVS